jgi:hypothetical protein
MIVANHLGSVTIAVVFDCPHDKPTVIPSIPHIRHAESFFAEFGG